MSNCDISGVYVVPATTYPATTSDYTYWPGPYYPYVEPINPVYPFVVPMPMPVPTLPSDQIGFWKVVGHCPKCGQPIWAQVALNVTDPPTTKRSCDCFKP